MSPSLKQKEAIPVFLVALVLACFAISRSVQAAEPPGIQNVNEFNTPFHRQFFLSMDPGQISDSRSFDLPAGKTLVVEFVSARASLPAGEQPILLEILSGSLVHDLLWNFVAQHGDRILL